MRADARRKHVRSATTSPNYRRSASNTCSVFHAGTEYQREVAERLHLPFALLSDDALTLTRAMRLPTFEVSGMTLLKRFTLAIDNGTVEHVFYPVFPPDRSAGDVIHWLAART